MRARSARSSASTATRLGRLRLAGLLHDVGKIGVPDAILNKPARLTDDEYEHMKRHALLGYDIVQRGRHGARGALGAPPPRALRRRRLPRRPVPARRSRSSRAIILVADAFEAMTSDRPYRRAPGQAFAIRELGRHAGTQFDPAVVEALTRVLARAGDVGSAPAAATLRGLRLSARAAPAGRRCRRPGSRAGPGVPGAASRAPRAARPPTRRRTGGWPGRPASRSRKTRSETLRSVIGMASIPKGFFGTLTCRPFVAKSASNLVRGRGLPAASARERAAARSPSARVTAGVFR